jgi:apolipoprotein N-acyltransferase
MAGHYQQDNSSREEQGLYVKRRLNPYGEYVPFGGENLPQEWRGLLAPLQERYLAVRGAQLFSSIWGKVGASINLEVAYPALVSDSVRKGASLLVFVANFNWFHNSNLGELALAMTQLRAIENGRYVVLATNSGISAIVDPTGTILTRSLPAKRGIIMDSVQFLFEKTPFTKMWWL